jgi:hypothetical protein
VKIYGQKSIEIVVDRHRDICGVSVMIDSNGVELEAVGKLTANWRCGSKMDGVKYAFEHESRFNCYITE